MSDTQQPAEVERAQEICGETYDHHIDAEERYPEGPWVCHRPECGAEIWPEDL